MIINELTRKKKLPGLSSEHGNQLYMNLTDNVNYFPYYIKKLEYQIFCESTHVMYLVNMSALLKITHVFIASTRCNFVGIFIMQVNE